MALGDLVGNIDDKEVGISVGVALGDLDGNIDGKEVGLTVGSSVGVCDGRYVGVLLTDGEIVGELLGDLIGNLVGTLLCKLLGETECSLVGPAVGEVDGVNEGALLGQIPSKSAKSKSMFTPGGGPLINIVIFDALSISSNTIKSK